MARRARRSVGAEVAASAEASSDQTLDLELEAYAQIQALYSDLGESIEDALAGADDLTPSAPVWVLIAAMVAGTTSAAADIVGDLLVASAVLSLGALAVELGLIESTLAGKYDGTTEAAMSAIVIDAVTRDAVAQARQDGQELAARVLADIEAERARAASSAAPREDLTERVVAASRRGGNAQRQRARGLAIGTTNDARDAVMDQFNAELVVRGGTPLVRKQVLSVIDDRTTVVCLHAAGQVRDLDEPFDTLNGLLQRPPFHWGCRSLVVPFAPGMGQQYRAAANAELMRRPRAERRLGPDGEIGGRVPGVPPIEEEERLPEDLAADGTLDIEDVPLEHRLGYMRAHAGRFSVSPNREGGSWWVNDGRQSWLLRK